MARKSYAAKQFETQVSALYPDAEFEHGDEDGLGVYRSLKLDRATSRALWAGMESNLDPRFASGVYANGVLTLMVQGSSKLADDKSPFTLPEPAEDAPADEDDTEAEDDDTAFTVPSGDEDAPDGDGDGEDTPETPDEPSERSWV